MRFPLRLAIGLVCFTASSTPAFADLRIWTGAGANNLWTTPQNWQGNVAPVAGDALGFSFGALQTTNVNNYANDTRFAFIEFQGTYNVTGNPVLLDNSLAVAGGIGVIVAFHCDITTSGTGTFSVIIFDDDSLVTTGVISGALPIRKEGLGLWNIGGTQANTYTGLTWVREGTVVLNKPASVAAVPAGLRIGDSVPAADADIVRLASPHQIVGPVETTPSGWLDLNGHDDAIGALTMTRGHITTGNGLLTLYDDVDAFDQNATIEGRLSLGGARTFTTHTTAASHTGLWIHATIVANGGEGGLIKRGTGALALAAANAYGGVTRVESGILWALHSQALGIAAADAGTIVLAGGQLAIGENVMFEPLLLEKNDTAIYAVQCSGAGMKEWRGPIHLTGSNGLFTPPQCTLRLGAVSGNGELWTTGNLVELADAGSTYVGDTRVTSGALRIAGPNRIPDTSIVRLASSSVLTLNGFDETVASITGASTSHVELGSGTLTVKSPAQTAATYPGVISGSGTVVHGGPGRWILTGANTYTGTTSVSQGTLRIDGSIAAASQVVVGGTGVLAGTGTTGVVAGVNGHFKPGVDGTGTFKTGSLALSAAHTVDFVLRPGGGTRIDAHGSVNLGSAALALEKSGGVQIDTPLVLIDNDGTDAIGGTFASLPEGGVIDAGDQQFRISYVGGTGNDVVIAPTELTYYLAEGSTGTFFDTEIAIANPHQTTVPVTVEFFIEGGGQVIARQYELAPMSRTSILVDTIPGVESAAVSTKVRSTTAAPIVVERTMWWGGDARYGAHTEKASAGAAGRWYFAEGSQGFFFTFLLLANPVAQDNVATVRYLLEGGGEVVRTYTLPPLSRQTVYAGDVPELVGQSFGMDVTFSRGGVAERAMYFGVDPLWTAGHESAGVTSPSTTWFLAEGATGPFFETFVLLANPNPAPADATVRFLPASGVPVVKQVSVPANGRVTINIEGEDASLANVPVATDVTSTIPIVVERAQYWPDPAPQWYEAHNSFGLTETATKWGLAEGRVGDAAAYQTYVLLANPTSTMASVTITFLRETGAPIVKQFTVNPQSRFNVTVGPGTDVPEITNERFGAVIESTVPIAVERALYANAGNHIWGAGTNATATRLP